VAIQTICTSIRVSRFNRYSISRPHKVSQSPDLCIS